MADFACLTVLCVGFFYQRRRRGGPKNWSGNVEFSGLVRHPATLKQLQDLVSSSSRVKAVGSAHSFSRIADSDGILVFLDKLDIGPPDLNDASGVLWVPSVFTYGDIVRFLDGKRWCLHNMASLPHITVGGSIATATHGSGMSLGNLSSACVGLEMVDSNGHLCKVNRETHPIDFNGYVVNLGALGVVTKVALQLVPTFEICQAVYEGLPFSVALEQLDTIMGNSGGYSVSLFTTWKDDVFEQVWRKCFLVGAHGDIENGGGGFSFPSSWVGGSTLAASSRHPIPGVGGETCTIQLGVPGHAHHRLPHFRMEFTPSAGEELQSEFFIPRRAAEAALRAVKALAQRVAPLLYISEIRAILSDDLWLSTAQGTGSWIAIHFTWLPDGKGVAELLPLLEEALAPFGARPHWGKVTSASMREKLPALYPNWEDFKALRRRVDPGGKFLNSHLIQMGLE